MSTEKRAGRSDSEIVADEILAIPRYRDRVLGLRDRRDSFGRDLVEVLRGRAHAKLREDPREAAQRARLGDLVATAIGDRSGHLSCLRARAQAAVQSGEYEAALRVLDAAAFDLDGRADAPNEIDLDVLRLTPLVHLERYEEAEATGRRVLAWYESVGNRGGILRTLMALADLAFRQDRARDALRLYARVEEHLPDRPSPRLLGALAANRANALEARNRFRAAIRQFEKARALFASEGCTHTVAQVDYNRAYTEMLRGCHAEALRRYARVMETFGALGDERHLAHGELDRAEIHLHLNMPEEARAHAGAAERRFRTLGQDRDCAQAILFGGQAEELLGDVPAASAAYRRAEQMFRSMGLLQRQLGCLVRRARLAEEAGCLGEAEKLVARTAGRLEWHANPLLAAALDLVRARLAIAGDEADTAVQVSREVRDRCRRIHAPWVQIEANHTLGRALVAADRPHEAVSAYRDAIEHLERYRGGVPPDEYMAAFLSGRRHLYAEIVALLVDLGEGEQAFHFAERARSRALVDLLARGPEGLEGRVRGSRRLRALKERLGAVYQRLFRRGGETDARTAHVEHRTRALAERLEARISRLLREERLAGSPASECVDTPDLAAIRRELDEDTVLVEYFVSSDRTVIFVVTPGEIRVVRTDVGEEEIRRLLSRFHFHLSQQERRTAGGSAPSLAATRANLSRLADLLIAPVRSSLSGRRLVIVPYGELHHLPFHALPWREGWLSDEFEIVYAPSAAVFGHCRRARASRVGGAAVLGIPDEFAPQIAAEARQVARFLDGGRLYLGGQATLEVLRRELSSARVVHVATHGMFRHAHPMLSSIRLADGWINLHDIHGLRVEAELVVLSTCESGTAGVTAGDEVLGLTRGFLSAGARTLLTSQWRVHDATTMAFMDRLYRHLRDSGDVAIAHRLAMADIRARQPHPYYWAPFFLTGRPDFVPGGPASSDTSEMTTVER